MSTEQPLPHSQATPEDAENKELRKKTLEEKKEEKDSLINLWMQDMGQAEKPKP